MTGRTAKFGNEIVPIPGFGCMGLSAFYGESDIEKSKETLRAAIKMGCTTWNTADMYGNGANETLLGSVLQEGDNRSKVFVITKFGNKWTEGKPGWEVDGSAEYAAQAIDASIARLGSAPDAWAVHRIDPKTPVEETALAMEKARKEGKTKYIGLSECSANTLRRACKVAKIDFIEVEFSPWEQVMAKNGVLAAAKELGVIVLAYSPLGRGFLTGRFQKHEDFVKPGDFRQMLPRMQKEVWEDNYKIVDAISKLAQKKAVTNGQLCLAWIMAQGENIIPIPGTKSEKYLIENFASRDVVLSAEELAEIDSIIAENAPKVRLFSHLSRCGRGLELLN